MRFLTLIPTLLLLAGCGHEAAKEANSGAARPEMPPVPVQLAEVLPQERNIVYEATGTVRAKASGVVSSKVPAYVQQVHANVGDIVKPGQKLATLDSRELDAGFRRVQAAQQEVKTAMAEADNGVAGAKAQLDLATATFQRMSQLAAKKSISRQELDEASARLQSARAAHEMARSRRAQLDSKLAQVDEERRAAAIMLEYASILSPFNGAVTARTVEPGNLATPGSPLFTIERSDGYRFEASVEESRIASIRPGMAVETEVEALGKKLPARVSEIVPSGDPAARSYTVRIDLPFASQLRSGMFGRARFSLGRRKVLIVPAGAVEERGQLQTVYVLEDGRARNRVVTIGAGSEVLSGLHEGEKVIAPIPLALHDGARVEVRP
jgi:membrane fusion protein, multidrug efflux system